MKKWTFFAALCLVFFPGKIYAQMIADIRTDVDTPFAIYHPYLATAQPAIPPLTVAPDFSNVVNFSQFNFTADERQLLERNHFVVSPRRLEWGTGYREMYDIYNEARERGIPILVTTDAMLHTFHLLFDRALKTCEEQRFFAWLDDLLAAIYRETVSQFATATDSPAQTALLRNIDYLNVARTLLDTTFVPEASTGRDREELALITQHDRYALSAIFGYFEDYTQYIVRGHYTGSNTLQRYFKTMMWLGRARFARQDTSATLSTIYLCQAVARANIDGRSALSIWEDIYQPTVFFVGKSDDLGPEVYLAIAYQVFGNSFPEHAPAILADPSKLS